MLLRCWKGDQFDSLNLTVFQQDVLYQSTYSTGLPTSLSAELKLFPEPEASMVTWKIKSLDGGSMDFHPGTESQDLNIVANKIEKVADDVFKFGLEIKELDDVAMKNISLVVVTSMEKEVIYFQPQEEIVVKTMFLTIPWWLWLSVCVGLFLLLCVLFIIYCTFRKTKQVNEETRRFHSRKKYSKNWYETKAEDGSSYYWNCDTEESIWDPPPGGFVTMTEQQRMTRLEELERNSLQK